MEAILGHALSVFAGFFAIVNPIANTPVIVGMTAGQTERERRAIAFRALATAFIILFFAVIGVQMLIAGIGGAVAGYQLAGHG